MTGEAEKVRRHESFVVLGNDGVCLLLGAFVLGWICAYELGGSSPANTESIEWRFNPLVASLDVVMGS